MLEIYIRIYFHTWTTEMAILFLKLFFWAQPCSSSYVACWVFMYGTAQYYVTPTGRVAAQSVTIHRNNLPPAVISHPTESWNHCTWCSRQHCVDDNVCHIWSLNLVVSSKPNSLTKTALQWFHDGWIPLKIWSFLVVQMPEDICIIISIKKGCCNWFLMLCRMWNMSVVWGNKICRRDQQS